MTPAMPTFAVGDLLILETGVNSNSITPPAITGYTQLTTNTLDKGYAIYARIAVGGDTSPTFQWDAGHQVFSRIISFSGNVYSDLATIVDGNSTELSNNQSVKIPVGAAGAPGSSNCLVIRAGRCVKTATSNGATFNDWAINTGIYTKAANTQLVQNGGAMATCFWYNFQTTPTAGSADTAALSITDSSQNANGVHLILKSATPAPYLPLPVTMETPALYAPRGLKAHQQEFWQVPIELRSIPPPVPPPFPYDSYTPQRPRFPISLLGMEQNLLESTLFGKDRVLTPVDWQYSWDPPQLPAALQYAGQGLDVSDITQLTTYSPYIEYNWTVPPGPRQWNRSFEAPVNLALRGQDTILLNGPNNMQWDPPPAPRQPIANRSYEQQSLSLFYTVPLKPPLSQSDWPVPLSARRPTQDFTQGMPQQILAYLTKFPPFLPSDALPPRKAVLPPVLIAYEWSRIALLKGQDILPFGTRFYDQLQVRIAYRADIYTIAQVSAFLIPTTSPLPPSGLGVKHMGRVLLDPAKVGEAVNVPFDFISGLNPGETVISAGTNATLYSGVDANPQAIITAAATVSGSIAFQKVTPTITGNIYDLRCTAVTNQGQILSLEGYFAVVPGLP